MRIAPITLRAAKRWIADHHRHSGVPLTAVILCSVVDDAGAVHGVAFAERPKAPGLADGTTLEVTRVCTDGAHNACSMLYAAIRSAARALGWRHLVTYTVVGEPGTSLVAAGFRRVASVTGRAWVTGNKRTRWLPGLYEPSSDIADRVRWEWP